MSKLVLYGTVENAKKLLPEFKSKGYVPECFCDMDKNKQNIQFLGYPVLSIDEVKKKFLDFKVYVTLKEPEVYEEISKLINEGVFREEQILNDIKEKYISCDYLEYGLEALSDGVYHCCGDQNTEDYAKLPIMPYDDTLFEDVDAFILRFIEQKRQIINGINNGKHTSCTGCPYLREDYWHKTKKIRRLNYSLDHACNLKCSYCYKKKNGYKHTSSLDVNKIITKFKTSKFISVEHPVIYSSGEISVQSDADEIISNLQEYEVAYISNGTRYNANLHNMIKKTSSSILISLDSGTRETYKRIKGVDLFDKVCENIKKYSSDGGNVILKYIIMEDNLNKADLDGFIDICKKSNVKNIRISRNWYEAEVTDKIKTAAIQLVYKAKRNNIFYYNDGTITCNNL
ncbi:radical SAM protein [Clostridium beijerinckii]|uniref:radical SAM protein n=1 Tax=Clostridium beijerinckii TaxID=1520 RepID=UPI0022E7A247|nr:radical SAM protein [Clostridium beijerinckii]